MTATQPPLLVVSIGTDPHRFDRLIDWVDGWLAEHEEVRAVIQHSTTLAPSHGEAVAYLPSKQLMELLAQASFVVCHGGTIVTECRQVGVVPIVVPRRRQLGEQVDDHQLAFCRRLARSGIIRCCETEAELRGELSLRLAQMRSNGRALVGRQQPLPAPGIERAAQELDRLMGAGQLQRKAGR